MLFHRLLKIGPFVLLMLLNVHTFSAQAREGGVSGGGGDASEMRVNQVRANILDWIQSGRAQDLRFPEGLTYEVYRNRMQQVLAPHAVIVGFVSTAQENDPSNQDPELKVIVNGQPKTCRGFVSTKDGAQHILCNSERFADTPEAKQYRLIHHEYAGLAGTEQNVGASSEYFISDQITDRLQLETILRLPVAVVEKRAPGIPQLPYAACEKPIQLENQHYQNMIKPRLKFAKRFVGAQVKSLSKLSKALTADRPMILTYLKNTIDADAYTRNQTLVTIASLEKKILSHGSYIDVSCPFLASESSAGNCFTMEGRGVSPNWKKTSTYFETYPGSFTVSACTTASLSNSAGDVMESCSYLDVGSGVIWGTTPKEALKLGKSYVEPNDYLYENLQIYYPMCLEAAGFEPPPAKNQ